MMSTAFMLLTRVSWRRARTGACALHAPRCLFAHQRTAMQDSSGKRGDFRLAALILSENSWQQCCSAKNCTVTIAHSRTQGLAEECARAEILVAAVGRAKMVKENWVKKGAIIIDVGMNRLTADADGNSKLTGDVDYDDVKNGWGCNTCSGRGWSHDNACLLKNTVTAACGLNV